MTITSGWCLVRGKPDCQRCRVVGCECLGCSNLAQNKGDVLGAAVAIGDNRNEPDRGALTPQPGSDHLPELPERG